MTINRPHFRAAPASLDREKRNFEAVTATSDPIMTKNGPEVLKLDGCDLSRLPVPLLDGHKSERMADQIGECTSVRVEGNAMIGTFTVKPGAAGDAFLDGLTEGSSFSVGYVIKKSEPGEGPNGEPVEIVTEWELVEVSAVPVPADPKARARGFDPVTAERHRVAEIVSIASRARVDDATVRSWINTGATVENVRAHALETMAARSDATRTIPGEMRDHDMSFENPNFRRDAASDAIASTLSGRALTGPGRAYADMIGGRVTLRALAGDCVTRAGGGGRFNRASDSEVFTRAMHGTTDFPLILGNAVGKQLRPHYEAFPGGVRPAYVESSARDFRAKSKVKIGEGPGLELVREHADFKRGTIGESGESYAVSTYGKIFSISRQAIINDDLAAFTGLSKIMASAAFNFEAGLLAGLITSNPVMSDGKTVFHADHGNLATGGGSALSVTAIGNGVVAMLKQKGIDGLTPIGVMPKYLMVPAALAMSSESILAENLTPATTANTVPQSIRKLEVLVDPRLDTASATAWYLAADPSMLDSLEYSYLDGAPGPQIETRTGFDVDGMEMKVRLDFGAGVIDWRGLYKANGA